MDLKIIAVGKMKDQNLRSLSEHYVSRIKHDARIEIVEIKDSTVEAEGKRLIEAISKNRSFVFALTEEGKQYTSQEFARKLEQINQPITFVIGGPFGLDPNVKKEVNELFSLSKCTFTHEMARVLLLEQIYRFLSILNNRKYHKE